MRAALACSLVLAVTLGGCAGNSGDPQSASPFVATESTGIILGLVVDGAIRPIPGANVTLAANPPRHSTTDANGSFGFAGLTPGSYQIRAKKPGFGEAQTVATVAAGDNQPPLVKFTLLFDPGLGSYVEAHVWDGYIECGSYAPVIGHFAICTAGPTLNAMLCPSGVCTGNVTQDHIFTFYMLTSLPEWVQAELVWQSTQQFGQGLQLFLSSSTPENAAGTGFDENLNVTRGASPLLGTLNRTVMAAAGIGTEKGLFPRVYPAPYDPTVQCIPGAGCDGVGIAVSQRFTAYFHFFFNYKPPSDWRFSATGLVPPPPGILTP